MATTVQMSQGHQPDKRAERVLQAFDRLVASRGNWETYWQEIAENLLPRYSGTFLQVNSRFNKGEKKTDLILDMTGPKGLERFAAVMDGMLTPRTQRWHRLRASNADLMRSLQVRQYFEQTNDILFRHRYSAKANFASQVHENWIGVGAFGNAGLFIEPPRDDERGLRYRAEPLGGLYVQANYFGVVDTFYRRLWLTARQAEQMFGKDALGPQLVKELDKPDKAKDPTKEFEFVHCVRPRGEDDAPKVGEEDMKWASIYVSRDDQNVVKTGGYYTFPLAFSRYVTAPHELYGRSPAMLALGAIKSLHEQKKTGLKAGHRAADPAFLVHDDGILDGLDNLPGHINYGGVNAQGQKLVHTLQDGSNWRPAEAMMDIDRSDVNDVFLVTLFQILTESPQMTATEVLERTREKGLLMAPTMGRQNSEYIGPMIERELDVLARQNMLPEMPPEMIEAEGEFEIEYDSPLSRAMRAEEAGGTMRFMEFAGLYGEATGDPSMFDHLDPDEMSPDMMWILNVPAKYRATEEQIAAKRQARQQQAEMQQAIEGAPAAAGIMKTLQGGEGGS